MFLWMTGINMWMIAGAIYVILIVICYFKERRETRIREAEREDRRRQQQREWREQFNVLSPTVRAAIRLVREDRRQTVAVLALLEYYRNKNSQRKEKVDWKQEGF